jgi:predicted amidohydrolase
VRDVRVNAAEALAAVGRLAGSRPDLVCLPEGFLYAGMRSDYPRTAAVDATTEVLGCFSRLAREARLYVAVPLLERSGDLVYNSVVLLDRCGHRIGTYRKRILYPSNASFAELENGVTPGDGGGPFATDFGQLGVQVCFEVHWSAPWRRLRAAGVRLILYPSEQSGGMLLRQRAWQARSFIVSSVSKGGPSQVIDPIGQPAAEWWPMTPGCTIDLGLDFEIVHLDHNEQKLTRLLREHRGLIEIAHYRRERLCRITSRRPGLDLPSLLREQGILSLDEYLRLAGKANRTAMLARRVADAAGRRPSAGVRSIRSVSVIVPCTGVSPEVLACLRAIRAQRVDLPVETVVVLNGPEGAAANLDAGGVCVVREPMPGPAAARNAGVRSASGDVLAFTDADCVPAPTWLAEALATLRRWEGRAIVAGGIVRFGQIRSWVALYDSVTFLQQERYAKDCGACVTANLVVHRSVFERVGPFDNAFAEAACEDWDWATRARHLAVPIVFTADAVVHHPCMSELRQLRLKAERLARGEHLLGRKAGKDFRLGLAAAIGRQVRRAAGHSQLELMDRVRVLLVGVLVAFWTWRAQRRAAGASKQYFASLGRTWRRLFAGARRGL